MSTKQCVFFLIICNSSRRKTKLEWIGEIEMNGKTHTSPNSIGRTCVSSWFVPQWNRKLKNETKLWSPFFSRVRARLNECVYVCGRWGLGKFQANFLPMIMKARKQYWLCYDQYNRFLCDSLIQGVYCGLQIKIHCHTHWFDSKWGKQTEKIQFENVQWMQKMCCCFVLWDHQSSRIDV